MKAWAGMDWAAGRWRRSPGDSVASAVYALPLVLLLLLAGCATTVVDRPEREVEASVDRRSHRLAAKIWGLHDAVPTPVEPARVASLVGGDEQEASGQATRGPAIQGTKPTASEGDPQGGDEAIEDLATLRSRFGPSILRSADGKSVTKQYFLSGHAREVFKNLLLVPGAAAVKLDQPQVVGGGDKEAGSILGRTLGRHSVELVYLADFERPQEVKIKAPVNGNQPPITQGQPNDLLLVTAKPAALGAFEDALNLFFANIPQVEIEVKVVEYSTTDALSLGVDVVDKNTPTFEQTSSKTLVRSITNKFPLTAPFVGGVDVAGRGVFTLGGIHDAWELNAQLQVLEANGIADVLSAPRVIVRNGGLATISTNTRFPYPQARITASGANVTAKIGFKPVGITLNIRPVIAGDDTVILQVYARVADVTSFTPTTPVPTPTVSTREAVTSVHVTDGRTTVIGGLVTKSILETDSQVPILGDIPILGLLFRSTSRTETETTLEFQITPRILRGESRFRGR